MIRKTFNFISIIMLVWTIISGAYLALPVEYKELIPEFNWITALVSGGSTGVLGTAILVVDNFIKKNELSVDGKYLDLANKFLALNDKYTALQKKVENQIEEQKETNELLQKTNRLISVNLESKLSNPLVEDFIKDKIRGEVIAKEE